MPSISHKQAVCAIFPLASRRSCPHLFFESHRGIVDSVDMSVQLRDRDREGLGFRPQDVLQRLLPMLFCPLLVGLLACPSTYRTSGVMRTHVDINAQTRRKGRKGRRSATHSLKRVPSGKMMNQNGRGYVWSPLIPLSKAFSSSCPQCHLAQQK